MNKFSGRMIAAILPIILITALLYAKTDIDTIVLLSSSIAVITILVLSVTVKWVSNVLSLNYVVIIGVFALIGISLMKPIDLIEYIGTIAVCSFLGLAVTFMFILPIYAAIFEISANKYWIKKGKHYSDGYKGKIFFFKRSFEFYYKLEPEGLNEKDLDNEGQWNKIFGITSMLHRRNSVRKVFQYVGSDVNYNEATYTYDKGERLSVTEVTERVSDVWYKVKVTPPRLIWFGRYHFPYHGGESPAGANYSILIDTKLPVELR